MLFAILFEDNDGHDNTRTKHMKDHLSFLESAADKIRVAGPLKNAETVAGSGGLWIAEAESRKEIQILVESDPFWPTGLRKNVNILEWTQVFRDGKRRI